MEIFKWVFKSGILENYGLSQNYSSRIMFIIIMFPFLLEITNKQQVAKKCTKKDKKKIFFMFYGRESEEIPKTLCRAVEKVV